MSILDETNGYKYQPEYWNTRLFAFICSTLSMNFENTSKNNDNKFSGAISRYSYITLDKKEYSDINKACIHQLKLLLGEEDKYSD